MEHGGIKTLDSARLAGLDWTRLDSAGGYTFPRVAIMSKPNSLWRVFVSLIGLHSTRLDSVGGYAPLLCCLSGTSGEAEEIIFIIETR
jgi:hypothetical protein